MENTWTSRTGACRILIGDCIESLRSLPAESVQCCITSPPYWGLRDYGHEGQIGLEKTPEEYTAKMVEVFREVRRVLRDDGTLWLNLGDSYNNTDKWGGGGGNTGKQTIAWTDGEDGCCHDPIDDTDSSLLSQCVRCRKCGGSGVVESWAVRRRRDAIHGLKPKDLVGIPWRVGLALQQPYYAGRIKDERDRIWLAAMLDAKGCLFIHKRKAGQSNGQGYSRQSDTYSPGVEICNTSTAIVERIMSIVGKGSISSQSPDQNSRRKQTIYRWNLRTTECRDLVRELYPHIVAKKQQARILCGCPSSGKLAEQAHAGLIALHRTGLSDVDFDPPATMFERGYYLRQDIVWSKPNPMPEPVTDRCTKAHEYIFLLAKSERYYYDHEAVKERGTSRPCGNTKPTKAARTEDERHRTTANSHNIEAADARNRRSVWTVSTKPYSGAHFATYPPDLIEPCVKAGCPEGGTILDPFNGSGTTGAVAVQFGRKYIGCEINPEYVELAKKRIGEAEERFGMPLFS